MKKAVSELDMYRGFQLDHLGKVLGGKAISIFLVTSR